MSFLTLIPFLSPIGAIIIYLRHGREPKVDYDGIYERELPTDDSPAVVNARTKPTAALNSFFILYYSFTVSCEFYLSFMSGNFR